MANDRGINVFLWPETAIPYFIADDPGRRDLIARSLPPGATLITGAPRILRQGDGVAGLWNSLFVLGGGGAIEATYDKMHLVPFGEYLPLRPVLGALGFDKLVEGLADFSPGRARHNIVAGNLPPFTPLICYEVIFPGAVAGTGTPARWMVNITNDGWYGNTTGPRQHLMAAKMRAIEEGLPLVRAAGTGISAVFDPLGRELAFLDFDRRGVVDSPLPLPASPGPYAKFGNSFLFLLLLGAALLSRCAFVSRLRH
jgi:apolipoprotein N-acyltransferase